METITVSMKKQKVSVYDDRGIDCTYITHLQTNISNDICFNEALGYFRKYIDAITQKYSDEINTKRGYISIEGATRDRDGFFWDFYIESDFDIEFIPEVSLNNQ